MAGVQGNIEARIFCFDLQAELISIAGNYKVSEDLDELLASVDFASQAVLSMAE